MKQFILLLILNLFFLRPNAQQYADFETFWKEFRTAVIQNDKQKVSNLSKYGEGGINVTNTTTAIKNKQEFVKKYNKVITSKTPVKWTANEIYGIKFLDEKQILFAKDDANGW